MVEWVMQIHPNILSKPRFIGPHSYKTLYMSYLKLGEDYLGELHWINQKENRMSWLETRKEVNCGSSSMAKWSMGDGMKNTDLPISPSFSRASCADCWCHLGHFVQQIRGGQSLLAECADRGHLGFCGTCPFCPNSKGLWWNSWPSSSNFWF